jgi:KipI family sensor histidine kinase inhibitor
MNNAAILPAGDRSLLLDLAGQAASPMASALRDGPWGIRLEAVVPTSSTVLVSAKKSTDLPDLKTYLTSFLEECHLHEPSASTGRTVTIPVVYDGPDLEYVAEKCGLSVEEVIKAHTGTPHRVGFFGFAPGFAYIDGLSPRLHLPRRESPRTDIPSGAVAIAANQSVVYPGNTPGGWHLIGKTTTRLWDLQANPPAKLNAGDTITFEPVGGTP